MTYVPGCCESCGSSEPLEHVVDIREGREIRFLNNRVLGACRKCGGTMRMIDGKAIFLDGGIELISGPQWSHDVVAELGLTLRRLVDDRPIDAFEQLATEFPAFADKVVSALSSVGSRTGELCDDLSEIGDGLSVMKEEAVKSARREVFFQLLSLLLTVWPTVSTCSRSPAK